ncbi:probable ATP-dependent RNA helicase DHX40 isoform X2 [Acropora muricata]|uniref:probable ATP-dependent RNA helicase DHX40 isoform X2 n=1 Tax=Acropora muricata TaxID=159855 RepID=UPI0034E47446
MPALLMSTYKMADRSKSRRSTFPNIDKFELPIRDYRRNLVRAVEENDFLVVVGETGSGKTTQLPQYLYKAGFTSHDKMIGVTQPRRIAAISVATRVSEEMKCHLGATVGYQVRFDDCTSDETAIKYMTDGCLLREFLADPALSKYSAIILDEAHERSLDTDILFGLVRKLFHKQSKNESRSHDNQIPKIIIMSATLNHEKFSEFFSGCPVLEIPGRCFPVKNLFLDYVGVKDLQTPSYLKRAVETVMRIHLEEPPGDILVFLTGQEEIEHACDRLFEAAENVDYSHDIYYNEVEAMMILPLYGSMVTELQKRVFDPPKSSVRKVVVATNIAATSLTIEGIRYVVDSGFVKQLSYNPRTRLDSLNVVLISSDVYETAMTEETVPEIQRTSLAHVILYLKSMGIHDVLGFQYIDPPEERMILEALKQLYFFGALDSGGNVTALGRKMTDFPLSPGLSRTVILSASLGCEDLLLPVAAMLSVENVFVSPGGKKNLSLATQIRKELAEEAGGTNDFATLLYIYKQCHSSSSPPRWCREHFIHWRALKMAHNVHKQLQEVLQRQVDRQSLQKEFLENTKKNSKELFRRALCNGYFCNVARKSSSGNSFRTMDGHGTQVYIHPSSSLFGSEDQLEWIIFHDIIWTSKIYVRTVCPIRYEWVKDLLPRLHEVDSYSLSGWAEGKLTSADRQGDAELVGKSARRGDQKQTECPDETIKISKRNTGDSITAARERFLERKRLRNGHQVT